MSNDYTAQLDLDDAERRTELWDEWRERGGDAGAEREAESN